MASKSSSEKRIVVFVSDQDEHVEEMLDYMTSEPKEKNMFIVDFSSIEKWQTYATQYPSLFTSGARYYKKKD